MWIFARQASLSRDGIGSGACALQHRLRQHRCEQEQSPGGLCPHCRPQEIPHGESELSPGRSNERLEVTTGQMPWQIAAVAVAGIAIWHFINRSKALRLLKEMQGKIIVNAEAATGDFALIRTMLTTRVIPQFDGLLEITSHLESELTDLRSVGTDPAQVPDARDRAFRLARSLVEGKQFLEMMAGD